MKKFRHLLKLIFHDVRFVRYWFHILAFRYGLKLKFLTTHIELVKYCKMGKIFRKIYIKGDKRNLGSTGIVLRDFDDFFQTVIPESVNCEAELIDFTRPKIHLLRNGFSFYFHDICEPGSVTDIYMKYADLKDGNVIFDIGCYCGTQTVYFSKKVGNTGKVFGFEPDPQSFDSLIRNLEINQCENVKALNLGVFSFDGMIGFETSGDMGASVSTESDIKIKVMTLDSIVNKYMIDKVDFIKMDIEGSEVDVIGSSFSFISKFHPRFIIEPHFNKGVLNVDLLEQLFLKVDYQTQLVKQGNFDYQPLLYAYPKTND